KAAPHTSSTVNILPAPQCRSTASRRLTRTGTLLRRCHSAPYPLSGTLCLCDLYQAPVTPSPIRAAVGRCSSGMKRDKQEGPRYRGLLACVRATLLLRPAAAKSLRR